MAPTDFPRRNPRYQQAGDWMYDPRRNRADNPPREKKPPQGSNLDVFNIMNEQGLSRDEAEYAAADLRSRGSRTGFGGKGVEPNRNLTQRERLQLGLDKRESSAPAGPTDDQRKWAEKFRESQTRPPPRAAATATPSADDTPGAASASARSGFLSKYGLKPQEADSRLPLRAAAGPINLSPAAATPKEPLNFSRSALIEGAKQSGDFSRIRGDFNKQSEASQTGMRMDKNGSMAPMDKTKVGGDGMTDFAREKFGPAVEDIRARRDFARGEAMDKSVSKGVGTMAKTNPYGSASSTYGGKSTGPGMMADPLTGKQVPMRQWAKDQTDVRGTKEGTSGWGENRTFNKAGDEFFNPQKLRESMSQRRGIV